MNKNKVHQIQELRRSSASSRHTPTPRKGTRTSRKAAALKDQSA